jgi:predicted flap endonuclease-1-like 5' DNA nuclease
MLRWLIRLLVLGLILAVVARVASRVLNREEDFEEFDDLDAGLEFTETPVEIDVPAEEGSSAQWGASQSLAPDFDAAASGRSAEATADEITEGSTAADTATAEEMVEDEGGTHSLIEIKGIGPTYASRLQEVGISSLEELANADPARVAEQIEVGGGRGTIENWIAQAQNLTSGGGQNGQTSGG